MRPEPVQQPEDKGDILTVLSANLWHDWPQYRQQMLRLERLARLIEQESVDIALLQEVSRRTDLRADEWLANRLGMAYAYARANGDEASIGFEEGVAVFSRFPIDSPALRHLTGGLNPFSRRIVLTARVATTVGAVDAFSAHLSPMPWVGNSQTDRLLTWVGERSGAEGVAFIGGDFNADESKQHVRRMRGNWLDLFRHVHPEAPGETYALRSPWGTTLYRNRLDYLFMASDQRPWRVVSARHVMAPGGSHSDHMAVLARVALASSAG
jgi:endonuclease/exonuclease/phosphatase family metal-dependent hydrolase